MPETSSNSRRIRTVTYVQQVEHLKISIAEIDAKLRKLATDYKEFEYAYILHDQDVTADGEKVKPHYHFILRTAKGSGWALERWASIFNDDTNRIGFFKGYWANGVSYLLHETDGARADNKHLYNADEIVANFDVNTVIATGKKEMTQANKSEVKTALESLDLNIDTFADLADNLIGASKVQFLRQAKDIIDYKSKKYKPSTELKTIYIYGKSGAGKTRLARALANDDANVYETASSRDPFGQYMGQKTVIFDDIRDEFEVGELLKLLDPYSLNRMAGSRYHDKNLRDVETMYITNIESPKAFFNKFYNNEPFEQFERRLSQIIKVENGKYQVLDGSEEHEYVLPWELNK